MIPNLTEITKRLIIERDALTHIYTNSTHKSAITSQTQKDINGHKPLNNAHTNNPSRLWGINKSFNENRA